MTFQLIQDPKYALLCYLQLHYQLHCHCLFHCHCPPATQSVSLTTCEWRNGTINDRKCERIFSSDWKRNKTCPQLNTADSHYTEQRLSSRNLKKENFFFGLCLNWFTTGIEFWIMSVWSSGHLFIVITVTTRAQEFGWCLLPSIQFINH